MTRRHIRQTIDTPLKKSEAVRQRGRCLLTPQMFFGNRPCNSVALRTCSQFSVTCDMFFCERSLWLQTECYLLNMSIQRTSLLHNQLIIVYISYCIVMHCIHVYDDIISPQRQFPHSLSPHDTGFTNRIRTQHFEAKVAQDSIAEAKAKSEAESKALETHIKWVSVSL